MGKDSWTLAEDDNAVIYFTCDQCQRAGRYRKATLIEQFGPDIVMPSLLGEVAKWRGCKHAERDNPYDPWFQSGFRCRIRYDITKMRPL